MVPHSLGIQMLGNIKLQHLVSTAGLEKDLKYVRSSVWWLQELCHAKYCRNHALNLVIVSSCKSVIGLIQGVDTIFWIFSKMKDNSL